MPTTQPSVLRQEVSRVSRPLLTRLHGLPRPVFPLLLVGLVAVAALAPLPVAFVAAAVVVLASLWLTYLSWPVLTGGGRAVRVLVLVCLVGLMASRFLR